MSKIVVFGASATETWEPIYAEAINLGRGLAELGHEVWNGGYFGLMGAISRGAHSVEGNVVGVTSQTFTFRSGPNPWLKNSIEAPNTINRLQIMLQNCDIAIALPGSIGTLNEIIMLMTLWKVNEIDSELLLWSEPYGALMNSLLTQGFLDQKLFNRIIFVKNWKEVISHPILGSQK